MPVVQPVDQAVAGTVEPDADKTMSDKTVCTENLSPITKEITPDDEQSKGGKTQDFKAGSEDTNIEHTEDGNIPGPVLSVSNDSGLDLGKEMETSESSINLETDNTTEGNTEVMETSSELNMTNESMPGMPGREGDSPDSFPGPGSSYLVQHMKTVSLGSPQSVDQDKFAAEDDDINVMSDEEEYINLIESDDDLMPLGSPKYENGKARKRKPKKAMTNGEQKKGKLEHGAADNIVNEESKTDDVQVDVQGGSDKGIEPHSFTEPLQGNENENVQTSEKGGVVCSETGSQPNKVPEYVGQAGIFMSGTGQPDDPLDSQKSSMVFGAFKLQDGTDQTPQDSETASRGSLFKLDNKVSKSVKEIEIKIEGSKDEKENKNSKKKGKTAEQEKDVEMKDAEDKKTTKTADNLQKSNTGQQTGYQTRSKTKAETKVCLLHFHSLAFLNIPAPLI